MGLLDGKSVVVTGGGRGIGREHCLELARRGARVMVVDPGLGVGGEESDERPADSVVAEIRAAGGEAVACHDSVTDWDTCRQIIDRTHQQFGRVDAVVNNAGFIRDRMITSMAESDFDDVIGVHLKGTFSMTKHACDYWRGLAKAGLPSVGRIVNTVSGAGLSGNIGQANYAAAKAGIAALTIVTALEMGRYGVTCNAISPVAMTRMTATIGVKAAEDDEDTFNPLHPRAASPVVAYLASDESAWLSGQVFRVEGNTVIRMTGWEQSDDRFSSRSGGYLDADELPSAMRTLYKTFPLGLVSPVK